MTAEQQLKVEPGYQVPFAERIRREAGIPTIAVGLITERLQYPLGVAPAAPSGAADPRAPVEGGDLDP